LPQRQASGRFFFEVVRFWLALLTFGSLSAASAAQDDYTLLVFGDSGTGTDAQRQVAEAMSQACREQDCDAALVLGDLIYPRGVKSVDDRRFETHFEEAYDVLGPFAFWMAPGNHDHKRSGSVDAEIAYTGSARSLRWRMPAAHYAVEDLPAWLHIYSLDTQPIVEGSAGSLQAEQARAALCGRPGWRLLMGHHPVYSNGSHGDYAGVGTYVEELVRDCAVQAYFAGHDHHQEHITTADFEQFVQGAAAQLRRVKTTRYPAGSGMKQQFARSALGFAIATFTERTLDVRFFDATAGRAAELYRCRATVDVPQCVPQ
jgi:acid phosphatase